jgi:DNA polymerase epsilon subunit 2
MGNSFNLYGSADARIAVFSERLSLAHARLMRHPTFAPRVAGSLHRDHVSLLTIDSLPTSIRGSSITLFGMLTQPEEGIWCLDDGQKSVVLDLSEATRGIGYFTETAVIIVQGTYDADATSSKSVSSSSEMNINESIEKNHHSIPIVDGRLFGVFRVEQISHPPVELREDALHAMGIVDSFNIIKTPKQADMMRRLELEAENAAENNKMSEAYDGSIIETDTWNNVGKSFIFLSDVHLDIPTTLPALESLLVGYIRAGSIPSLLVLMGNFSSQPFGQNAGDRDLYRSRFEALADTLAKVPELAANGCRVVLVPGPNDPGTSGALPRPPIPAFFAQKLLTQENPNIPNVILTTNPARIRYFTREIVVFRCDLTSRMRKRAVLSPFPPDVDAVAHVC